MYLTIIVTVLVVTQVIRVIQNGINLYIGNRKIEKTISWIKDQDITERDFEVQREVFYMLYDLLKEERWDRKSKH